MVHKGVFKVRVYEGSLDGKRAIVAVHNKDELQRVTGASRKEVQAKWQETDNRSLISAAKKSVGEPVFI